MAKGNSMEFVSPEELQRMQSVDGDDDDLPMTPIKAAPPRPRKFVEQGQEQAVYLKLEREAFDKFKKAVAVFANCPTHEAAKQLTAVMQEYQTGWMRGRIRMPPRVRQMVEG